MHRAVCPGSFDPVDQRAPRHHPAAPSALYDEVKWWLVGTSTAKHGLFTVDERVEMLGEVTGSRQRQDRPFPRVCWWISAWPTGITGGGQGAAGGQRL